MLPMQQGEAWVQLVTQARQVAIAVVCTRNTDKPTRPRSITSHNCCSNPYQPSPFRSQTQSKKSRSCGCHLCRSSTRSWTFHTWPI